MIYLKLFHFIYSNIVAQNKFYYLKKRNHVYFDCVVVEATNLFLVKIWIKMVGCFHVTVCLYLKLSNREVLLDVQTVVITDY